MKSDLAVFLFWAIHWSHVIKIIIIINIQETWLRVYESPFLTHKGKKHHTLVYHNDQKSHNYEIKFKIMAFMRWKVDSKNYGIEHLKLGYTEFYKTFYKNCQFLCHI